MNESPRPYTLVAELTYECPLRCAYCSNPVDYARHADTLDAATWLRVFREAEELGVVQLHFTGGEPLVRRDLEDLIAGAHALDLYTNLITSGVPLTRDRLERFRTAGLDNVQLSFQAASPDLSDRIAGPGFFQRKLEVARWVKELGFPLTVNVVLHRANIDQVEAIVALAEALHADRLELANAQYVGWALPNRSALLPRRDQIERARDVARGARERLIGKMEVLFVTPDYFSDFPKACMDGWGRRFLVIAPDGLVLPCHAAHTLPGLAFDRASEQPLAKIWNESSGLNAFRGEEWMIEPCRTCPRRAKDFGGCRCQAFHLAGNAALTDPACSLSPDHHIVTEARALVAKLHDVPRYIYRTRGFENQGEFPSPQPSPRGREGL
jgi:PqqA peptide cyclase